jgi:hypothetical protein
VRVSYRRICLSCIPAGAPGRQQAVPDAKKLGRTAEKALSASSRGKDAVLLLSLAFKRGAVSLAQIKSVPATKRRP